MAAALLICLVGCGGTPPATTVTPAPPSPALQPTLATDPAAIDEASRIRMDWGLESASDWVSEVAQSSEAVESALGIPLLPEEVAELETLFASDPRSRLVAYGVANRTQWGGSYVDNAAGTFVMLFTADVERHRAALARLPGNVDFEVRPARFTEADLLAVMNEVNDEVAAMSSVQLVSTSLDTIRNVVSVAVRAPGPQIKVALESRFPGMVAVDVLPMPGAWQNRPAGTGWRLLAAGVQRSPSVEPYSVHAATKDAEWSALWTELDPVNERPAVDIATEIVVAFVHGISVSCPERRLDDIVIAGDAMHSVVSDPLAPRGCDDDLSGVAFFVVAVERAALPRSRLTIRLSHDPPGAAEDLVVELP